VASVELISAQFSRLRADTRIPNPQLLFMRMLHSAAAACAYMLAASSPLLAQSDAPARQMTLDAGVVGLKFGIAARTSAHTSVGISIGAGGNWFNYMALGGRHFAEAGGPSYQKKDGAVNKELLELFRASVFVRREFDAGRQLDVGLKASGFLHSDSSDDDPGGGAFVGVDVTGMWWRWRALRLGSQVDIGRYSEGRPELGVNVAPILMRLSF
jgi:hypothetical protein